MAKRPGKEIGAKSPAPEPKKPGYVLRLYVAGTSRKSLRAIQNLKRLMEGELAGQYELEVIDIYQQPIFAKSGQIVAAPTLIRELPAPLRKLVGDLSDTDKVLAGLDLMQRECKEVGW